MNIRLAHNRFVEVRYIVNSRYLKTVADACVGVRFRSLKAVALWSKIKDELELAQMTHLAEHQRRP